MHRCGIITYEEIIRVSSCVRLKQKRFAKANLRNAFYRNEVIIFILLWWDKLTWLQLRKPATDFLITNKRNRAFYWYCYYNTFRWLQMSTVFINKHFHHQVHVMETSFCRAFNLVTKFAFFRTDVKKHFTSWWTGNRPPPFLEINNFLLLLWQGLCNSVFGVGF